MNVWLNGEFILGNTRRTRGRRGPIFVGSGVHPIVKGKSEILARVDVSDPQRAHNFSFSMTNPNSEQSEISEASMMRKAKLWANDGEPDHADASRDFLEAILNRQPEKRLNIDIMMTMVRALIGQEAYRRALVLSARLLRCTPPEKYERTLLLSQVQARLGLRELEEARAIFIKRLNKDFPYSEETLKAREAIIQCVMEERRKEAESN